MGVSAASMLAPVALACGLGACDLLPFSSADAPADPTVDAGPAEVAIVDAHNQVRAQATPPPSTPLAPMQWSGAAAAVAQAWARQCTYGHSQTPGYGENIYASTSTQPTGSDAVAAWASEIVDYDYTANS